MEPRRQPPAAPPWPSPQTDPTNPFRQESVGVFVPAERATERRIDEVGLTDRDRDERLGNISGGTR
jgi:hypothetical protein